MKLSPQSVCAILTALWFHSSSGQKLIATTNIKKYYEEPVARKYDFIKPRYYGVTTAEATDEHNADQPPMHEPFSGISDLNSSDTLQQNLQDFKDEGNTAYMNSYAQNSGNSYDTAPFSRINNAEQRHMQYPQPPPSGPTLPPFPLAPSPYNFYGALPCGHRSTCACGCPSTAPTLPQPQPLFPPVFPQLPPLPPLLPPAPKFCPPPPLCPPIPPPLPCPTPLPCPPPPPPCQCPLPPLVFPPLPPPPSLPPLPSLPLFPPPLLPPPPPCAMPFNYIPQNDCCCNCQRPCRNIRLHKYSVAAARAAKTRKNGVIETGLNAKCNSEQLRQIIQENISSDLEESKRKIQFTAETSMKRQFNTICGKSEFSFIVHAKIYCQERLNDTTCYVFSHY